MAKGRTPKDDFDDDAIIENQQDIDFEDVFNSITKEQVGASVYTYIIAPYENNFNSEAKKMSFIKPAEYMKAWEMLTKLKGFDKEAGETLPDEIELKL